jgi:hypothetical protein
MVECNYKEYRVLLTFLGFRRVDKGKAILENFDKTWCFALDLMFWLF